MRNVLTPWRLCSNCKRPRTQLAAAGCDTPRLRLTIEPFWSRGQCYHPGNTGVAVGDASALAVETPAVNFQE
jgi:hypothetical protein